MNNIYSDKRFNSFEKLIILFLIWNGYLSDSEYKYLPKNSQIGKMLNADPSAVSKAFKKFKQLNILIYNENNQVKLNNKEDM